MKERYFFAIGEFRDNMFVFIVPEKFWEENGCINETYTTEQEAELRPILEKLQIHFEEEGQHAVLGSYDFDTLYNLMIQNGFTENTDFIEYLAEEDEGDLE